MNLCVIESSSVPKNSWWNLDHVKKQKKSWKPFKMAKTAGILVLNNILAETQQQKRRHSVNSCMFDRQANLSSQKKFGPTQRRGSATSDMNTTEALLLQSRVKTFDIFVSNFWTATNNNNEYSLETNCLTEISHAIPATEEQEAQPPKQKKDKVQKQKLILTALSFLILTILSLCKGM